MRRPDPERWAIALLLTAGIALVVKRLGALWRSTA